MGRKKRTFGSRLYVMFMCSILISVFIAIVSFWFYSMHEIMEREERNARNILNSVSQNMELQFTEIRKIKDTFYITNIFQEAEKLNNPQLYQYYDNLTRIQLEDNYIMTLTKMMHTSAQEIRAIVFFPASGEDTAYYLGKDNASIREITYENYTEEAWYQQALEDPSKVIYCEPYIPEYMMNKKLGAVYSYVQAVMNVDTKKAIGIVKIDVDDGALCEMLRSIEDIGDNGVLILREDVVFARSDTLEGSVEQIGENRMRVGARTYQMKKQQISGTNLEVVYLNNYSSLYKGYLKAGISSAVAIFLGGFLAFVSYRYQAKKMIEDVGSIISVIQKIEKGELDNHIELNKGSEFEVISDGINQMTDNLKKYIEKEYILAIQQQKAQYQALQSQVNPHFLYNTLNGFVALNRMGEKQILEKSILGLARLFRYTCEGEGTATVGEEFDFLEEYLKLEKLKFDERLEYLICMDEACRKKQIPRLLLQPVVENSIRHGMGNTDRPLSIEIFAACIPVVGIGSVLILRVKDDGEGFDKAGVKSDGRHMGMENVQARGELYSERMIYQCISVPGKGTETVFIFPEEV